jgi:hypothetical protein
MKVTFKMTLDGLVRALRWRQIDFLEQPSRELKQIDKAKSVVAKTPRSREGRDQNER